ncbi:MAG TPA: PIN domain-containing protein [Urbifossiella sp.]|nr:PIN domain-containing protein [Urbifossiella sp.]
MNVLLDTSVLVRLANTGDKQYATADAAVRKLVSQGHVLHITPQAVIEFRAVATRPVFANGLGLTPALCDQKIAVFETGYRLLDDLPLNYPTWTMIVQVLGVVGKTVHDARLVAVCHVHSVTHVLTFNLSQYRTLATAPPGVVILDPATV